MFLKLSADAVASRFPFGGCEMLGVGPDTCLDMDDLVMPGQDEALRRRRFEVLYAQYRAPVLGYIVRRIAVDEAADVMAETFLVAWRRLDQVPDGERAGLWLYGVARRNLANHRRGEHRRTQLADRLRTEIAVDGSIAEPPGAGTAGAVAFRSLSDKDRELLTLSGWEDLDPGEIGVVLGCSRNAARIRLHRARRRLRAALAAARAQEDASTSPGGSTRAEPKSPSPSGHLDSDERSTARSLDLIVAKGETS